MKQTAVFYLIVTVSLQSGCVLDRQASDGLPFIDVRKNYPEKEIVLTDIADITYLHLKTDDADYLYSGSIFYETENTLLVADESSNSILFFSRNGNPVSRFNRYGQGPEEYFYAGFKNLIYDEATDEVFVPVSLLRSGYIQVYSSTGEHKRKLTLPQGVAIGIASVITSFDDKTLLLYDHNKLSEKIHKKNAGDKLAFSPQLNDSSYVLISKSDGKLLEYVEMPSHAIDLSLRSATGSLRFTTRVYITKNAEGFLLCNPGNDTIYLYKKDKSLTPVLRKIPLMIDGSMHILNKCVDAGGYQFIYISQRSMNVEEAHSAKYYMRNKETGEIFQQKISLPIHIENVRTETGRERKQT